MSFLRGVLIQTEIEIAKGFRQMLPYIAFAFVALVAFLTALSAKNPPAKGMIVSGQYIMIVSASSGINIGSLFLLVMGSFGISHESGNGIFRMVFPKPLSRAEYYLGKFLYLAVIALCIFFIALLIGYIMGGSLMGYGDIIDPSAPNLPVEIDHTMAMLRTRIIWAFVLTFLATLAICAYAQFLSVLTDKSGIAVGLTIGGFMFLELLKVLLPSLHPWLFSTYSAPLVFGDSFVTLNPLKVVADFSRRFVPEWTSWMFWRPVYASLGAFAGFLSLGFLLLHRKDIQQ